MLAKSSSLKTTLPCTSVINISSAVDSVNSIEKILLVGFSDNLILVD